MKSQIDGLIVIEFTVDSLFSEVSKFFSDKFKKKQLS